MKILHVCAPSKRIMETFVKMTRERYPVGEHKFLFWDKCSIGDRVLMNYGNVVELKGNSRKERYANMVNELRSADMVVWHGLIHGGKRMLFLLMHGRFLKKSIWIMHGIDLYSWKKEDKSIKSKVLNFVRKKVYKKIPFIVSVTPEDQEVYKEQFGDSKKRTFYTIAKPFSKNVFENMQNMSKTLPRKNGVKYVLIANNAYPCNNHLQLISMLSRYNKEDVSFILPLSYGNDWNETEANYTSRVTAVARKTFGTKVTITKRLVPPTEYDKVLWNVDVGVFGSYRQNALGNILRLLYFGNKVFIPKQNLLYGFFNSNGVKVYDTETISDMSYEDFVSKSEELDTTRLWIIKHYHPDCATFRFDFLYNDVAYRLGITKRKPESVNEKIIEEKARELHQNKNKTRINEVRKDPYINLLRYVEQKKGTVLANCRNVTILGSSFRAKFLYNLLRADNARKTRWFVDGFVGYKENIFPNCINSPDVISTPEDYVWNENTVFLSAVENPYERKQMSDIIKSKGGMFRNYAIYGFKGGMLDIKMGCILGKNARLDPTTQIGEQTYIFDVTVAYGVNIGNYVTILNNTRIGKFVTIGDFAYIGENVTIRDGVTIGEGAVILDDEEIKEDVPASDSLLNWQRERSQ